MHEMSYFQRISNLILSGDGLLVAVVAVLTIFSVVGVKNLDLTTDNRVFFGDTNPQLKEFEEFENTFTESNTLMVVFYAGGESIFSKNTLSALLEFTQAAWKLPHANRVESLSNYSHSYAVEDDIFVKDLVYSTDIENSDYLDELKQITASDPLIARRLVSESGKTTAVFINFLYEGSNEKSAIADIVVSLQSALGDVRSQFPDLDVYTTGDIILGHTIEQATNDDVSKLLPLMLLIMLVLIGLVLRSVWASVAVFIVILLSVVAALGIAGWLGYILNPGSAIAPTIILTIAIADAVHIVSNTTDGMRQGFSRKEAVAESLKLNILPVTLTTLTTACGFLMLNMSDAPPFNDLGNIVAIGCLTAWTHSIIILPWLLGRLPIRIQKDTFSPVNKFESFSEWVIKHHFAVSLIVIVGLVIMMLGVSRISLTDRWVTYFDERYDFRTHSDFIIENHSGVESIEFNLRAVGPDQISSVEYLSTVDRFGEWLRQQENIDYVVTVADIFKRLNMNMHGDNPDYYRLPQNDGEAAQYLLLYELSLPVGSDLQDRIDILRESTRVTATGDLTSIQHRQLEAKSDDWLRENAPDYMHTQATGMSTLFAHISERNISTMLFGTLLLLAGISVLLAVLLRSITFGIMSLVPNLLPPIAAVGLWGWVYGELGMAVAVVGAITLGIIVDDTIHMLTKYRAARVAGSNNNAEQRIGYMFRISGKSIFTTTFALALGFGILGFSGFQVNWAMGTLTAWTVLIALITDFTLIPALLLKFDSKSGATPLKQ